MKKKSDNKSEDIAEESKADIAEESKADIVEESKADIAEESKADIAEENKKRNKKRNKKKKTGKYYVIETIRKIVMLAALCIFTYSSYQLTNVYLDYEDGDDAYENIEDKIFVPVISSDDGEPETDINGNEITNGQAEAKFSFDYDALLQVNSSALGWIKLDDVLSYPILQAMDNVYYLTHNAAHQTNKSGAIFVDYRVEGGLDAQNCIIYGHDMLNGSMFGSLIKYASESYYREHPSFDIYVGKTHYKYYVFSAYETDYIGYTYSYNFATDEDFQNYLNDSYARKYYQTDVTTLSPSDKIITLSTCTRNDDTKRFIVQLVRGEEVQD